MLIRLQACTVINPPVELKSNKAKSIPLISVLPMLAMLYLISVAPLSLDAMVFWMRIGKPVDQPLRLLTGEQVVRVLLDEFR